MSYCYIDTDALLKPLLAEIKLTSRLLLDTEFIRVSTYFPKLGLLQLHLNSVDYLIDPVGLNDLPSLWEALFADNKLFVFHSCKEDLDVMHVCAKKLPAQVFDTQVAAAFLGYGPSLGYAALVEKICSVAVSKDQTLTDWLARPLTEAQKQYAAKDVSYLQPLYDHLVYHLTEAGKMTWFNEEMHLLLEAKQQVVNVDELYKEINGAWQLYPSELAVLRELAKWRYITAIDENKPQNFVLKEDLLVELSRKRPETEKALLQLDISSQQRNRYAAAILNCIQIGMQCESDNQPNRIKRIIDYPQYKHDFKEIKNKIQTVADKYNLPIELLGSRKLINHYLLWSYEGKSDNQDQPKLLTGWRHSLLQLQ